MCCVSCGYSCPRTPFLRHVLRLMHALASQILRHRTSSKFVAATRFTALANSSARPDMNLSNLVHRTHTNTRPRTTSTSSPFSPPDLQVRLQNSQKQDMTALVAGPLISQSPTYTRSPQPPPSPPEDSNLNRTLPSIQSLIGMDVPQSSQEQQR